MGCSHLRDKQRLSSQTQCHIVDWFNHISIRQSGTEDHTINKYNETMRKKTNFTRGYK